MKSFLFSAPFKRVLSAAALLGTLGLGSMAAQAATASVSLASTGAFPPILYTNDTARATASASGGSGNYQFQFVWKKISGGATTIVRSTAFTSAATDDLNLQIPGFGDKNDTVSVEVVVRDLTQSGDSGAATASKIIANSPPFILPLQVSTSVNRPTLARFETSDADGDALTFTQTSSPASGTVSGFTSNDGLFLYTPGAAAGTASFGATVSDGSATSTTGTASITVGAASAAPRTYTALGASDVNGVGAGDYPAAPAQGESPAQAYAPLLNGKQNAMYGANQWNLSRRAVNGFAASDALRSVGGQTLLGLAVADNPQAVTVWYGPNDAIGFATAFPNPDANTRAFFLAGFASNYQTILTQLQSAPSSPKIVVANVPRIGDLPVATAYGLSQNQKDSLNALCRDLSDRINALAAAKGIPVVDLYSSSVTNPTPPGEIAGDGFHPSSAGYARLSDSFWLLLRPLLDRKPISAPQSVFATSGATLSGNVSATDPDLDETAAPTFQKVTDPAHGTATLGASGAFTYTPSASYTGADGFTFSASDSVGAGAPATVTISVSSAAGAIISEFRFHGATGGADEYIELRNKTGAPLDISGWKLQTRFAAGPSGLQTTLVPAGTVIPTFGHFLFTGSGYSLSATAPGDLGIAGDMLDNSGAALLNAAGAVQDAVGFAASDAALREGAGLPNYPTSNGEYAFMRDFVVSQEKDTSDSSQDFVLVSTSGVGVPGSPATVAAQLGAPSPEGLSSPAYFNHQTLTTLLDPSVSAGVAPNRDRIVGGGTLGTLIVRRTIKNNSSVSIKRMRFGVVSISSLNSAGSGAAQADVRLISASGGNVTLANGTTVAVSGTTLEADGAGQPAQPLGGALGSSFNDSDVTLATPLAPGQSRNFEFRLKIEKGGNYFIYFNILALAG